MSVFPFSWLYMYVFPFSSRVCANHFIFSSCLSRDLRRKLVVRGWRHNFLLLARYVLDFYGGYVVFI
jgi:hypothetical protein